MPPADDRFLWLEDIEGQQALAWVAQKNAAALEIFQSDSRFAEFEQAALRIYEASDKIPYGALRGGFVYNFWQDADHVRGIWRRATLEAYQQEPIAWDVLLDIDALAVQEDENWVYKGVASLPPEHVRCLVFLSRGGKDAVVIREYDLTTRAFVSDGFYVPEAKSGITWVNANEVLVATDFGPDTMTESGYASMVKRWRRGQALEDAELVVAIDKTEMGVWPHTQFRPEGAYTCVMRAMSFWSQETLLCDETGAPRKVNLPDDANFQGFWNGDALAILRSDWRGACQGDVVALKMPTDELVVLYHPHERASAGYVATTRDALIIGTLDNVTNVLREVRCADGEWVSAILPFDRTSEVDVAAADEFTNDYFVVANNFLTPSTLYLHNPDLETPRPLKHLPARFDAAGLEVQQLWAVSKDGTQIPYFVVARQGLEKDGRNPTLLYGYGGFEIPMTPGYNSITGKLWLEQGGVYALANIRGGGEFGPQWHQAALQQNRHKAFEDFISVAEDLIARQITSPQKLGIMGGSNGGLLMGAMLTQRPDLFRGIICAVPLLDMLRYHKLLAGASWVEEYGDPDDDEMRAYLAGYSPYQHVFPDRVYPQAFFITSTKDDRVHPGHARKMVAKMESLGYKVFYYENTEGGHSAGANLKQHAKMDALEYVYLHKVLIDE